MRIGFDLRPAQGPSAGRGIGRYTRSLLRAMASRAGTGVEWTLIAWDGRPLPDLPAGARVATVADRDQAPVRWARRIGKSGPALLLHRALDRRALARIARQERLDALLLPALFERDFFGAEGLACATVKVCHDLGPHHSGEAYGQGGLYARMYRAEVRALARAEAVVAISEATRRDVLALSGADAERVPVIYQGVDPVFRPKSSLDVQEMRQRFSPERPYLLASGGLGENKNLETVIDALALVQKAGEPRPKLLALGAPPEQFYPRRAEILARAQAQGLAVGEDLMFLPHVTDRELATLYTGSLALVFPSRFEGFGLPPAECMACGGPVIVSHTTSLPEVVGDAGIVVDPDDAEAIASAILRLRDDHDFRQERIARGRAQSARFTWEQTAVQMWELLERTTRQPSGQNL